MQLSIQGHGLNISRRFETYVNNKAEKLDRYLPGVEDVRVEVTPQSAKDDAPKAIQLTVRRKRTLLRVEERNTDIYTGFDRALDNMYQRIAKYKGKRVGNKRNGQAADAELEAAEDLPIDVDEYAEPKPVVKIKSFTIVPMSSEEAIEQMELIGHDFFVFINDASDATNVVYRRKDGSYGLIQPEK
ncbi:MAG TPA: ribosome-associated translation inhibitor RaiA [Thermoflexales bacterium]|nr:ribosome-associated translation inhibitor RaiA [Thermoflexales bacterium]HQW36690.1 ribosome-associated translation inhibitor RaiA [Thermoflexales bacterium]HQZ23257.1 ribosome-associated translation inhibitor RaiA [Thermoflexales bacterium]HQZ99964.1 ribosome-associated translation inhibitor RaiA [Thermoflexales bacterium]